MKTVFDYNITEKEWNDICGMDKDFYLKHCTEDDANLDLAYLFWYRGEKEKAKTYAEKLPLSTKNSFWRNVTHP